MARQSKDPGRLLRSRILDDPQWAIKESILFAAERKDDIVAKIGNGYGSECHLLRWMGRHRNLFNERVSKAVGRPGAPIDWLDFGFAPKKLWPDAELRGLEFLYDRPGLKPKWQDFWPTRGGIHNWDAVGWIGEEPERELLLLEAKSYGKEMETDCGAKCPRSIQKIEQSFEKVKECLGASPQDDWIRGYYQAANRIATLYFVQRERVPARLLFVYFLGDRVPRRECPRTADGWETAITAQWKHLGLAPGHCLSDRVHELFLPISEPLP